MFGDERKRRAALRAAWGRPADRARDVAAIAAYHRHHAGLGAAVLDVRTARDLGLDALFASLDRTASPLGQQALYHRLHREDIPDADRAAFERVVGEISENAARREALQLKLHALGHASSLDLWSLTQPDALPDTRWYRVFPVLALVTLAAAAAIPFFPAAWLVVLLSTVVSLALRASIASWLLVVAGPFRQLGPLVGVAESMAATLPPGLDPGVDALGIDIASLARLRRIARISRRDSGAPGDLVGLAMEYLNLVLYLDGNALFFARRELQRHRASLASVIAVVGRVDAAIAVASWRAGHDGWSRPAFDASDLQIDAMWHPLLQAPVANDVAIGAGRGLIVTGSNMSGKTTYLKATGVTAVMASTINTVPAALYRGPVLKVRASIEHADSLAEGKSYYFAEAEAVLASIAESRGQAPCLFLFDELFRGTNRTERLAAGEAVMRTLVAGTPHMAVVATHDAELVDQLADRYRPVHFDGHVHDGVLRFDFHARPGRATSRNAIALLAQMGAPADLIAAATDRAGELDQASSGSSQRRGPAG